MIAGAIKAAEQMFSAPFRVVLLKSMALAIALLVVVGIALDRLLVWLGGAGSAWIEGTLGGAAHLPVVVLGWIIAFVVGFGLFAGAVFLMPAVTALVGGFFADEIALLVERDHYPRDPPGRPVPFARAALEGVRTALLALGVYLFAAPFLLVAGLGLVIFFLANAYLLGREYFELVSMRTLDPASAKALRRANRGGVFAAGMIVAAFVSIPILNLATPLFATALMVHVRKRIAEEEARAPAKRISSETR
ncbi:MAG: sulfate transporter family protein [Proteobacteria bacterium]|nr:sulfate transporter family protein [Pseudomonadota bacterium]